MRLGTRPLLRQDARERQKEETARAPMAKLMTRSVDRDRLAQFSKRKADSITDSSAAIALEMSSLPAI
jgi:hypothetical protein